MALSQVTFPAPCGNGSVNVSCTIDTSSGVHGQIDFVEKCIAEQLAPVEMPVEHTFLEGMYVRKITMKAGILCTSKIHKTRHPFLVVSGKAKVFDPVKGWHLIEGPYAGITMPGTRRILHILEDMIWYTFHAEEITDLRQIEDDVIFAHDSGANELREKLIQGGTS